MSNQQEPTDEAQLHAFRACPKLSSVEAAAHCPHIMKVVMLITNTLGVCWQWVLAAALVITAGLVPQARYELAPSVDVPSSMWVLLLHPGATNTSGVVKLVVETVQMLMARLEEHENAEAKQAADAEGQDIVHPPRRQLLAGGGSLAATGMQMSQKQNRSAALCAEPEIGQLLQWFSCDSGIDAGAIAKLWDSVAWERPVMDKHRAFSVPAPWLSTITGGHIPETFRATKKDVFGFRQRVTALFGEPLWLSMAETRKNCALLPIPSHRPAEFLAALLLPVLLWSVKQEKLVYHACEEDGAREYSDANFDGHLSCQREAFLKPGLHDDAKYHGKLRTKFDRMVLATHFFHAICEQFVNYMDSSPPGHQLPSTTNWCSQFAVPAVISKNVVTFAYIFSDHSEKVWRTLDFARKDHVLPEEDEEDPSEPTQVVPTPVVQRTVSYVLFASAWDQKSSHDQAVSAQDLDKFLMSPSQDAKRFLSTLPLADWLSCAVLMNIMKLILGSAGRWFYWSQNDGVKKSIKKALPRQAAKKAVCYAFLAAFVLQALGLGKVVSTVDAPGGGRRNWFFLKKPPVNAMLAILAVFGYTAESVPSLASFTAGVQTCAAVPPRAPPYATQVFPAGFVEHELDEVLALLRTATALAGAQLPGDAHEDAEVEEETEADGFGR